MVPLAVRLGGFVGRKRPRAVGRDRQERIELRFTNAENIAVAGEPVGFAFAAFFIVLFVAEIENLAFDAFRESALAGA